MSWLDHRTGIETAIRNFLYEEIPASSACSVEAKRQASVSRSQAGSADVAL